jgi:teichuronic acid biosynthesis glycosyltransferase TuaC
VRSLTCAGDLQTSLRLLMVTNMFPTAAAPDDGTPVADEHAALEAAGCEVELLHVPREGGGPRVYLGLGRQVDRLLNRVPSDLVVVMYGGVMADVVTRAVRDVPVVLTFRGTDLLGGRGRGVVHGLARRYGVIASRRAAPRAGGIVVKSRNLLAALPPAVDRSRVWVVPDGVDLDRFRPRDRAECRAALGWAPERRHLVFPGAAARPEKRFWLAEAAVAHLRAAGVDAELHPLEGVPHDGVATFLNAADAVLLTSAHEGSPNVVKEALACDVPIVSVDVGDVRERVQGLDGCHIADPHPRDLAQKLADVLARGGDVAGRDRVRDLALPSVAARLVSIYSAVAAAAARPAQAMGVGR